MLDFLFYQLAMPRGIGYAGTARLVTLSAEPLCMAAPKGGSCCGGGGGGVSKYSLKFLCQNNNLLNMCMSF